MEQGDLFTAILPYAGTSGWSGSDTSRDRAISADARGVTGERQQETIRWLDQMGTVGLTWQELSSLTGWHHGTASGALSVLHKDGVICRLSDSRDRCKVYVLPENVGDRDVEEHGRKRECPECGHRF